MYTPLGKVSADKVKAALKGIEGVVMPEDHKHGFFVYPEKSEALFNTLYNGMYVLEYDKNIGDTESCFRLLKVTSQKPDICDSNVRVTDGKYSWRTCGAFLIPDEARFKLFYEPKSKPMAKAAPLTTKAKKPVKRPGPSKPTPRSSVVGKPVYSAKSYWGSVYRGTVVKGFADSKRFSVKFSDGETYVMSGKYLFDTRKEANAH